jgi:hypothetical protein
MEVYINKQTNKYTQQTDAEEFDFSLNTPKSKLYDVTYSTSISFSKREVTLLKPPTLLLRGWPTFIKANMSVSPFEGVRKQCVQIPNKQQ